MPTQPTERDDQNRLLYRPGFYIKVIGNAFVTDGQGSGSVREWVSNASSLLNAMDDLYLRYKTAPEAAAGKIPVVAITGANPIKTGSGTRASTNYAPIFEIRSWAPRPEPMLGPRTTPIPGQEPPAAVKINGGSTPLPPTPPVTQTAPVTQTRPEAWETTIPATSAPVQKAAPTPDAMPF
jgi:hypothetical protein